MDFESRFNSIWSSIEDLQLPEKGPDWCVFAVKFSEWIDEIFNFTEDPTVVSINQVNLQLLHKYFEWFRSIPKNHRYRIGPKGHTCIFQVFQSAYERLKVIELAITPPLLFIPPEPPPPLPPPPPQPLQPIAGIFLGELEGENIEEEESNS